MWIDGGGELNGWGEIPGSSGSGERTEIRSKRRWKSCAKDIENEVGKTGGDGQRASGGGKGGTKEARCRGR